MPVLARTTSPPRTALSAMGRALLQTAPIAICYVSVGFATGLIAAQAQFSFRQAVLFALLVYSGSGESIGLQMMTLGQPVFSIASTAAMMNLRYFLFSATLAPHLGHWPAPMRYFFAFTVTDETFALHAHEFRKGPPPLTYAMTVNLACWFAWTGGNALGHFTGSLLQDVHRYGLDFAMPGTFVALVVLQVENRRLLFLALLGAALAVVLRCSPLQNWAVLIAGVATATVGALGETWTRRPR